MSSKLKDASAYQLMKYKLWKSSALMGARMDNLRLKFVRAAGGDMRRFCAHHFLKTHPELPSQLSFVYSDGDTICPPDSIAEFHESLEKAGNRHIEVLRFKDSAHVEHYRRYPKEYESLIDGFLRSLEEQDDFPRIPRSKI
ncbi:hypothetical protein WR25_25753 [Diploscapter pachys]|uniref:Serine aminopeptidase S33 domain-containing protein n=1 Tax=Diploscapter pachys TaxID=2018661 RepID=A0A2A2JDR8_9BILA|nr:hypothetical protein WR25_25753 [Diploscapter pachys]